MQKDPRGRKTIAKKVQENLGLKSQKETYAHLVKEMGDVQTMKEAVAKLHEVAGVKTTSNAVRNMLRVGNKRGYVRAGTPLHSLTQITRGRPLGYSPKKAKA